MAVIYTLTKSPLVKSGGQLYWDIDSPSEQQPLKIVNGRGVLRGERLKGKLIPMLLLKLII